jgi:hypothetical protein
VVSCQGWHEDGAACFDYGCAEEHITDPADFADEGEFCEAPVDQEMMEAAIRDRGVARESDQLAEVVKRQQDRMMASGRVDRAGWTDAQWIEDARRLMNEPDGAITSLVNGHVMALLRTVSSG